MAHDDRLPHLGLQGDLSGTCIACLQPTDTALNTAGESEWHIAFLTVLGVPEDQATAVVSDTSGADPGMVRDDTFSMTWQVCSRCVETKTKFPPPTLAVVGGSIPCIRQP